MSGSTPWDDTDLDLLEMIHTPISIASLTPSISLLTRKVRLVCSTNVATQRRTWFFYIYTTPAIYNFATSQFVDLGIRNSRSIEIPKFVKTSITRKRGGGLARTIYRIQHSGQR